MSIADELKFYKHEAEKVEFYRNKACELYEELQHYKDLEEQGRLIKLPCPLGSRIYYIGLSGVIYSIHLDKLKDCLMYADDNYNLKDGYFLTEEEAEEALKRLQGNE